MWNLTPKQVFQHASAQYGIVWNARQTSKIVPHEVYGNHPFVDVSKSWAFEFGQGCVGRSYSQHETIVVENEHDDLGADFFLRKQLAIEFGIRTIAFIPQDNGSVFEVGFELKLDQLPKNWWMGNLLDISSNGAKAQKAITRLRTPSPDYMLHCRMVGASINESIQHAMARPALSLVSAPSIGSMQIATMVPAVKIPEPVCGVQIRIFKDNVSENGSVEIPDCSTTDLRSNSDLRSETESFTDSGGSVCNLVHEEHPYTWENVEWFEEEEQSGVQAKCDGVAEQPTTPDTSNLSSALLKWLNSNKEGLFAKGDGIPGDKRQLDLASHIPTPCRLPNAGMQLELSKHLQDPQIKSADPTDDTCHPCYLPTDGDFLSIPPNPTVGHIDDYDSPVVSVISKGTVGHPFSCGGACKYNSAKGRCKQGAACDRCHICVWTRAAERALTNLKKHSSVGSVGHPFACAGACKYHCNKGSNKVCKDGSQCARCHLCTWTLAGERALARRKSALQF